MVMLIENLVKMNSEKNWRVPCHIRIPTRVEFELILNKLFKSVNEF